MYSVRPASTDRQKLVSVPEEDAAPERAGPGGRRGGEILSNKVNLDIFGKLVKFWDKKKKRNFFILTTA